MISVKEVVRQARVNALQDVDADDFAFNDKAMLDALNDAVQRALKLKPILRWTNTYTYKQPEDFRVSSIDDTLDINPEYEEALMMGTAANICTRLQADEAMQKNGQRFEQEFIALMRM